MCTIGICGVVGDLANILKGGSGSSTDSREEIIDDIMADVDMNPDGFLAGWTEADKYVLNLCCTISATADFCCSQRKVALLGLCGWDGFRGNCDLLTC